MHVVNAALKCGRYGPTVALHVATAGPWLPTSLPVFRKILRPASVGEHQLRGPWFGYDVGIHRSLLAHPGIGDRKPWHFDKRSS
jgi:hypothetical protein